MSKIVRKDLQILIDEKLGQLFLGDKKKDIRLLMLRPIDLIEFSEFAGTNAEDIIIWVGKSIGKSYIDKFFSDKDWKKETMTTKVEIIIVILEALELMGFGHLIPIFKKKYVSIEIEEPLALDEYNNIMAKNLCLLNQGIFSGIFDALEIDVDGKEIECVLLDDDKCVFKYDLLYDEIDEGLIKKEEEKVYSFSLRDL
ncbi:MAG: hypothetical protein ACFFC3_03535 [Candidatus Odinarchaeota archaeon]